MKTARNNLHVMSCTLYLILLILISYYGQAQVRSDTSTYLPQINFNASNGLGPYVIGTAQENTFMVSDLPDETSKVVLKFLDVDSIQIGSAYTETGSSLTSVSWAVQLDSMDLPLSPQLNIELTYKTDSIAKYYIAYTVYPDTINMVASHGWGPFITNAYPLSDTSWQPVPELENTFTVSQLPPRTLKVKFEIVIADSTVIDSLIVNANPGAFLDSTSFPNIRMDLLPLSTRYVRATLWCNGGPKKGIEFHKNLIIIPQKPRLISFVEGSVIDDSVAPFTQNQIAGNALLVDSVKYAVITNGPGLNTDFGGQYQGPASLDLIVGEFTVEAWLQMDLDWIMANPQNEMVFMMVDSVWGFVIRNYGGQVLFEIHCLALGNDWPLYAILIPFENFNNSPWHHVAFTLKANPPPTFEIAFYLHGEYHWVMVDQNTYDYIKNSTLYYEDLLTKPLILGGCIAHLNPNTPDYSFVTAMDEVRIWSRALGNEEIRENFQKTVLQDTSLVGYWNFNDLRNRLGTVSDISFKNNSGQLKNGATFIPQYPQLMKIMDTIVVISSNAETDTIVFTFVDANNRPVDADTLLATNGKDTLIYDISSLPYEISHLRISEHYPGVADTGFNTLYELTGYAPPPIATPQYNWINIYTDTLNPGELYTPVTVSNLPQNTQKVVLGLTKGETQYDTTIFTYNTVPYGYSLGLNGTDNYVETSQKIESPGDFTIMLWFKTATKKGGKIIGFTQNQNGITADYYDRGIYMETDGSIRFRIDIGGAIHQLWGSNIYNDGEWHHVAATVDNSFGVGLYIDGCLVDWLSATNTFNYQGYWVIGRS
ncbi:MAG: hypothetical protein HQ542_02200, partial [Bacteroidia bacterium]|nr:hypothetical protein [Bacteroidia bacterium]